MSALLADVFVSWHSRDCNSRTGVRGQEKAWGTWGSLEGKCIPRLSYAAPDSGRRRENQRVSQGRPGVWSGLKGLKGATTPTERVGRPAQRDTREAGAG